MSGPVRIAAIGRAAPESRLDGRLALEMSRRLVDDPDHAKLDALYRSSGIDGRGCVIAPGGAAEQLFREGAERVPRTTERLALYMDAAIELASRASGSALARAEVAAAAVTHLVTVSCTGAQSPGIDHGLIERLGLSRDVARTHIGFMGCHGAINGLSVAASIAGAEPEARVLVACVELCSLHYHVGGTWDQQVANAIFADGAASAVVRAGDGGGGPLVRGFGSRVFEGTANLMRWDIGDHGFEMRLSARVPGVLRRSVGPWVDDWLGRLDVGRGDIAAWAVHPGGRDILEGVRRGLGLRSRELAASERVLREHGNMSSGTVLWVIDELLRAGTRGLIAGLSFGPGLSGEGVLLAIGD